MKPIRHCEPPHIPPIGVAIGFVSPTRSRSSGRVRCKGECHGWSALSRRPYESRISSYDTGVAIAFFAILAALTLTLVGVTRSFAPIECSLDPRSMLPYADSAATAYSRRGAPCFVAPHNSDGRIKSLEVVAGPRNGKISMQGLNRTFLCSEFAVQGNGFRCMFRVLRRSDANEVVASIVNMTVNVDWTTESRRRSPRASARASFPLPRSACRLEVLAGSAFCGYETGHRAAGGNRRRRDEDTDDRLDRHGPHGLRDGGVAVESRLRRLDLEPHPLEGRAADENRRQGRGKSSPTRLAWMCVLDRSTGKDLRESISARMACAAGKKDPPIVVDCSTIWSTTPRYS